ncbi:hypothetical protein C2E21_6400 [Chlorella sorokiniana]|uniref:Uncharacterized protein n=1 Tax=Chlorella sorokiniana TaxID=3076 RepID=A0A2P6TLG0_CHLSO|nr:hypothetical protein C2E21_6400 [Chlorella sorokiniana]|eukprot:PRW45124.1 hypothetical protein C2E21_6400 [Chlorella sorokiniana]
MEEMGLVEASCGLTAAAAAPPQLPAVERAPRLKKRRAPEPEPASLEPTRLSRRLRGETALSAEAAAAAGRAEAEAEGRDRRATVRKQLTLVEGHQLAAPFTLWSIGVTVWELGQLQRGAWAHRYWSSSGCLFHHAYPVGYRATKVVFGRTYDMRIEEGPAGPLFKVIDQQTGTEFSGESPTKPWTDVCIAQRTGQRISGPLFFGFSDPLTQRAIAINLYSPAELAAALRGERVVAVEASPEEQAARELCSVEGVGEATAIVLARTTALGGTRHTGLDSLRSWASASDANAQALFDFLTSSCEVPESTRQLPAWRQRLVPRIVLALSGRQLGSGGEAAAAAKGAAVSAAQRACSGGGTRRSAQSMVRVCAGVDAWLRTLAKDEYRRTTNANVAANDSAGWAFIAAAMPTLLALRVGHQPGMLLLGGYIVLVALSLWVLLKYRRGTYIAHREALVVMGYAPVLLFAALQQSFTSHLPLHGGSSLRMLLLLLAAHPGTWCCMGALYGGIVVGDNQLILPTLMLSVVWAGNRSMCEQLLRVPGAEPLVRRLHWAASSLHTGLLLPPVFAQVGQPLQPLQQCLVLNAWLTGAVGALLPLFIQSQLEAAARRRFDERRQQHGDHSGHSSGRLEWRGMEWSTLFCCSFLCWQAADAAYSLAHTASALAPH